VTAAPGVGVGDGEGEGSCGKTFGAPTASRKITVARRFKRTLSG
jgi:hypothetical protein